MAAPVRSEPARSSFPMRFAGVYAATISCRCSPKPSMPRVTTSPTLRNCGGFMPVPTPGGVPVVTISPGISVMNCETYEMHFAIEKIMVGRSRLAAGTIDVQPHRELLHVGYLVFGHQPRADRT